MLPSKRNFLEKYYKACNTCFIADWADAADAAKDMYNESRTSIDEYDEAQIKADSEKYMANSWESV